MTTDTFSPGDHYAGFSCTRVTPLPSLRATAYEFEHQGCGTRVLHLLTDDIENCFAVTFPTPPPDETGLPHIMEHSTLAGSKKYPVREPFFELIKMSMATFINAMTSQSFTVYPVATTVRQDFFNLVDVYMDAIFHPQLSEDTFRREGHHLALEDNEDMESPLTISGIVYSEMKGYWSTPDNLISNLGTRGLFPDTPLGRDSGGNPDHIPELTYEQFKAFYESHYHPSNALVYLYGDIPTREHLDVLSPLLANVSPNPIPMTAPRQPRWSSPRRVEQEYPIGPQEDTSERTFIVMDWLVADAMDPDIAMDWSVLSALLLGHEAAPLKKAIIDSKLGADLYPSGEFAHAYELVFEVGIKGSERDRAEAFETLVQKALEKITATPFTHEEVDAAFHQLAYHHLEVEKLFPLKLLWLCNETWPYGEDPLVFLDMERHLADSRARYAADPGLFNRLIQTGLLENEHRVTVVIHPDPGAQTKVEQAYAETMVTRKAALPDEDVRHLAREAAALSEAQTTPNTPDQLATLPQLSVRDLPDSPRCIPTTVSSVAEMTMLRNDVSTNGVNYLSIDIDLSGLPTGLYAALPRFTEAVAKMGAAGQTFEQVAQRRAAHTGSLSCNVSVQRHATDPGHLLRHVYFGLKTIDNRAGDALALLHDLIFSVDPRDTARLHDILTQAQAAYRTSLVSNALQTARRHAGRGLTREAALDHLFSCREGLPVLNDQLARFDDCADTVMQQIEQIRDFLRDRSRWTISFTGSDGVCDQVQHTLNAWAPALSNVPVADVPPPFERVTPPREGLAAPIKVAHCAKVMPAPAFSDPDTPLYELGLYLADFDYMLPEIRFKGNAYGAGTQYNPQQGTLSLFSYNDPRITETLEVFDGLRDFVQAADWTQTDVDRAIIGSAKKSVQAIRPAEATGAALSRHVRGETDDLRAERFAIARGATPASIKRVLLAQLEAAEPQAGLCVAAGREALEQANRTLGDRPLDISDILGESETSPSA